MASRIVFCGLLIGLIPLITHVPERQSEQLTALIVAYGIASLAYLYIWRHWRALDGNHRALAVILAISALGQFCQLYLPPILSEDLWLYLWDGCVQWGGFNPYGLAPNDPLLDPVVADATIGRNREQVGHPHIPTIYPPTAQIVFLGVTAISPDPMVLRGLICIANLGVTITLWQWSKIRHQPPQVAVLYAFAPLPIIEGAIGGHIDGVGVLFLVLAAYMMDRGFKSRAGIFTGLAIGVKLAPVIVLPTLLRRWPKTVAASIFCLVAMCIPYFSAGQGALSGLRSYAHRWEGNSSIFALIRWPLDQRLGSEANMDVPAWFASMIRLVVGGDIQGNPIQGDELVFGITKMLVALCLGISVLLVLVRAKRIEDSFAPCMMLICLLSPILHPWYLVWILPFAIMAEAEGRTWWSRAAIGWSLLVWLAYLPRPAFLETGVWQVAIWIPWLEYLPVYGLIGWQIVRASKQKNHHQSVT